MEQKTQVYFFLSDMYVNSFYWPPYHVPSTNMCNLIGGALELVAIVVPIFVSDTKDVALVYDGAPFLTNLILLFCRRTLLPQLILLAV